MKPGLRYYLPPVPPPEERAAVLRRFSEFTVKWRLLALEGAGVFNEVRRLGIHLYEGASSVADLATERGVTSSCAREIENLGKAVVSHMEVRPDVEQGDMPVANAAVVGRLDPEEDWAPGMDWLTWARIEKPRDFLRRFQEHRERIYVGQPVMPFRAFVTYTAYTNFQRARKLASRSFNEVLSDGRTLGLLALEYLQKHDPLLKKGAARRAPDTSGPTAAVFGNGTRYIPAEVVREVRARRWDKCAVEFCSKDTFLTFSHRTPHRDGGSREADNLDLLCGPHHMLYEQGVIVIEGTPDDPVFKTVDGRVIGADGCNSDFLNAKAERDNAESLARWTAKQAEAAARAKAGSPQKSGPSPPVDPPRGDPPRGDPPNADPPNPDPPDGPIEDVDIPF